MSARKGTDGKGSSRKSFATFLSRKSSAIPEDDAEETEELEVAKAPVRRHLPVQAGSFADRRDADALTRLETESAAQVIEAGLWKYHRLLPPMEDSITRQRFHWLLTMMLYYTCLWMPMRTTFFAELRTGTAWRIIDSIDVGIDCCFWLDVALNMRTAYKDEGNDELVTDWRKIVRRYMAFWFWIEALATVPWDLLSGIFQVRHTVILGRWAGGLQPPRQSCRSGP